MFHSYRSISLLLLFLCTLTCGGASDTNGVSTAEKITTSKCNNVRTKTYQAKLDLRYYYLIEYPSNVTVDLHLLEQAIAVSLASGLDSCNEMDLPLYAVQITNQHEFSDADGTCSPEKDGDVCRIVRGVSSILLDSGVRDLDSTAYGLIENVLQDTNHLVDLTGIPLTNTRFLDSIGQSIVLLNGQPDTTTAERSTATTTKIAVTAAGVSFCFTLILILGVYRNHRTSLNAAKLRMAHMQAKRRHYFSELEDDPSAGWMVADSPTQLPSLTWSVSDLTSDSQSIKSSLPLDRIDEEEPPLDEEVPSNEVLDSSPDKSYASTEGVDFIAHWKSEISAQREDTSSPVPMNSPIVFWEESDEDTPVRGNRSQDQSPVLLGIDYVDDSLQASSDASGEDWNALDDSNLTDPTCDDSWEVFYSPQAKDRSRAETIFSTPDTGDEVKEQSSEMVMDMIDEVLERWFVNLCVQLSRALSQRRLTHG